MKISELPRLNALRDNIEFPIALEGENYNVTLGQIAYAMPPEIVRFLIARDRPANVQFAEVASPNMAGNALYDTQDNRFYFVKSSTTNVDGQTVTTWTYYNDWSTYNSFHKSDGKIRQDCLFCDSLGRLYFSLNGQKIKSAGITDEQTEQIRHATPIEVASEEEMSNRIAAGEYEEGQLYFLAES